MIDALKIDKPQRWDQPFSEDMTDADVEFVLGIEPFKRMDADRFPAALPLADIIKNDTRLLECSEGEIIVREGDYGNSAFLVVSGNVQVVLPPGIPESMLGRGEKPRKNIFEAVSQLWQNPKTPEVRSHAGNGGKASPTSPQNAGGQAHIFLQDISKQIPDIRSVTLSKGDMIGEIAALARTPRSSTVIAGENARVLEIRWQALRDIRQRVVEFREMVDQLYRERSLAHHLQSIPLFQHLKQEQLDIITRETIFETYGNFDWYASYKRAVENYDYNKLIEEEPLIVGEGDYIDGLLLVRSGFVRVSYEVNQGTKTNSYLGKGSVYGLSEIVANQAGEHVRSKYSLRALGYTDVLRVPTKVIEDLVLPWLSLNLLQQYDYLSDVDNIASDKEQPLDSTLLEHMVERRFINGTATMLIDLDRCVRCDECVTACANGHNNNPRFIRHGAIHDNYMVANACMQCQDPVCMIGCPTGAIHRTLDGIININDQSCIGCSTCANSCPYDNIQMVPVRNDKGDFMVDVQTHNPIQKATKCDLCQDQIGGPACQRACPHDALVRMDMRDTSALTEWIKR